MTQWFARISPALKARIAGALYMFSLLVGGLESALQGALGYAAGVVAILTMAIVTLLTWAIFRPVGRRLAALAGLFAAVGLALEAFRLQPFGLNIAVVFHGLYCLVIGYLMLSSTFVPLALGGVLMLAGVAWLSFVSNVLVHLLSPYNLVCGVIGDLAVFLWLLLMGVNEPRWKAMAGT